MKHIQDLFHFSMEVGHSLVLIGKLSCLRQPGRQSLRDITGGESQSPKITRCEVRSSDLVSLGSIDHVI